MQKKQQAPKTPPAVPPSTKLNVEVDMTPVNVEMSYHEVALAYAILAFIGDALKPNSFPINIKLRTCRRALQPHAQDLDELTQSLTVKLMTRDAEGETVRDDKGNYTVKQPDFDIERASFLRTTVQVTTPVWHNRELLWIQDVKVEGMDTGFIFHVLEGLGPLFVPD